MNENEILMEAIDSLNSRLMTIEFLNDEYYANEDRDSRDLMYLRSIYHEKINFLYERLGDLI